MTKAVRRVASVEDIDAQIAKLMEKKKKLLDKRLADFGRLAEKARLLELDIPEENLLEALRELADRFRGTPAPAHHHAAERAATAAE